MHPSMAGNRSCHQQQRQAMNPPSYSANMYPHQNRPSRSIHAPPNAVVYPSGSVSGMPMTNYGPSAYNTQPNVPLSQPVVYCNLGSSAQITTPSHPANINFRTLPFFKIRHKVIPPVILVHNTPMSLNPSVQKSSNQEFHISFVLTCEMASALAMNRDSTKNEYNILAQLRITAKDNNSNVADHQYDDFLPLGLVIRVNNKLCTTIPAAAPTARQGVESRRIPKPINISHMLKLSPMNANSIVINWAAENGRSYVMTLNLVEKLSSEFLISKLKERSTIPVDVTKRTIREHFKRVLDDDDDDDNADEDDDDISATIVRVSLQCPLSKLRISFPAKGKNCSHLQCFDGCAYIQMNERKPTWNCPVCNKPVYFEDLLIDQYFVDVLKTDQHSEEVQLFVDGTWKSYEDNADSNDKCGKNDSTSSPGGSPKREASMADSGLGDDNFTDRKDGPFKVPINEFSTNNTIAGPVVDLTWEEEDDENDQGNEQNDEISTNNTASNNMENPVPTPSYSNADYGFESSSNRRNGQNLNSNDDKSITNLTSPVSNTLPSGGIISLDSPSPSPPKVSSSSPPPSNIASLHIADRE